MNKLSVIVTGRNDNYDGDFDDRLCLAMNRNIKNLPDAEFIFVEWNPFLDKPLTCQKLKKIFKDRVKYYAVDPKFHDTYCTIDGFLEYPPKNVGVRRASGDFIACTNSDIIFCPDLVASLKKDLERKTVYRATRIDILNSYRHVKFPLHPRFKIEEFHGLTNACGDFLLLDRDSWHEATGYCEEFPAQRLHKDSEMVCRLVEKEKLPVVYLGTVTHWRHPSSWVNGFTQICGDINWDYKNTGFLKNKETWGLSLAQEINKDGITWLM
jgi:hypothetical protein